MARELSLTLDVTVSNERCDEAVGLLAQAARDLLAKYKEDDKIIHGQWRLDNAPSF